jgi:uncharacterized protein (DUF488 family)
LNTIYTIGHSTHSLDAFIALLRGAGVEAVADVRSVPFSRRLPHFSQGALRRALPGIDIAYVPLGPELGGRGNPHSVRDASGRVSYRSVAASPEFSEGLRRVESGSARMRVALLCTERDPLQCHRGILISRVLAARGTRVVHILADGATETHGDAELRLLRMAGARHPDLFRTGDEALAAAYDAQEARIAHVAAPAARTTPGAGRPAGEPRR